MSGGHSFSNQNQLTIKASASTGPRQSTQDTGRGLSISGQSKPAPKSLNKATPTGARQQLCKAPPSCGLAIAGQSSNAQQSNPRDKPHQQRPQKRQPDRMTRKRASSSATLEIVGAAPQPKQRQSQPEPAITANGGGGVSISGTAEGTASKLDMALPPSHAQEENTDGSSAKRLKISGERKKRSIFGYRMEALLTDSAAGNRRPAGSPEQKSQTEAVGLAIASTRTSAAASNGDGAGRLRIARSAADVPETVRNPGLR